MFRSFLHITSTEFICGANEPPLDMRRICLSLQYCVKLMFNEVNPAYSAVFHSNMVATYEVKERTIKLGIKD